MGYLQTGYVLFEERTARGALVRFSINLNAKRKRIYTIVKHGKEYRYIDLTLSELRQVFEGLQDVNFNLRLREEKVLLSIERSSYEEVKLLLKPYSSGLRLFIQRWYLSYGQWKHSYAVTFTRDEYPLLRKGMELFLGLTVKTAVEPRRSKFERSDIYRRYRSWGNPAPFYRGRRKPLPC